MKISKGYHNSREQGMCAMEAVAWIAGERHSDHPRCTHHLIANFVRDWNDALLDHERDDIMVPLIPMLVGTYENDSGKIKQLVHDWLKWIFPRFYNGPVDYRDKEELGRCAFYAALELLPGSPVGIQKRIAPIYEIQMSASDLVERMCNAY